MKLMQQFESLFGTNKPIIAMVHLGALPGSPLYDADFGVEGLVNNAEADLEALQAADVDAILFGNENDRPYELEVSSASSAAAAFIIGCLKKRIKIPL